MKKIFIAVGALTLLGGVVMWGKYQSELAQKLVFDMKNAKLKKLNGNEIILDFDFEIKNPTDIAIDISSIEIDIYANDKFATKITTKNPTSLLSNRDNYIPLSMSFSPKVIFSDFGFLVDIASNMKNIRLKFQGKIRVRKFGLNIPVPFTYETTYGALMG